MKNKITQYAVFFIKFKKNWKECPLKILKTTNITFIIIKESKPFSVTIQIPTLIEVKRCKIHKGLDI